jgi:lipooligosaccharide transport system ATP-binding protein
MDQGKILVEGAPRELIERHIGADVIEVAEPTEALLELVRLRGLPHDRLTKRLLVYAADGEQFFREVAGRCPAGGCVLRQATLEDVFLKLTGRGLRE